MVKPNNKRSRYKYSRIDSAIKKILWSKEKYWVCTTSLSRISSINIVLSSSDGEIESRERIECSNLLLFLKESHGHC